MGCKNHQKKVVQDNFFSHPQEVYIYIYTAYLWYMLELQLI